MIYIPLNQFDQIDDACNIRDKIYNFIRYHVDRMSIVLDQPFTESISNATDLLATIDMSKIETDNLTDVSGEYDVSEIRTILPSLTLENYMGIIPDGMTIDLTDHQCIEDFTMLYQADYDAYIESGEGELSLQEYLNQQLVGELAYNKKVFDLSTQLKQYLGDKVGVILIYEGYNEQNIFTGDYLATEEALLYVWG